jgi:MYXO-CTERM domain-containing protein
LPPGFPAPGLQPEGVTIGDVMLSRLRRSGRLLLAGAVLAAVAAPAPARADGPGYGGTADALTVQWEDQSAALAVYAVGFRGGSTVHLRVGASPERAVTADPSGALRLVVGAVAGASADMTVLPMPDATTGRLSPGTSVLVAGQTPTGALRTLVGAVPPPAASTGPADMVPWAAAVAMLGGSAMWLRRRRPDAVALVARYRHTARHRG